VNIFVQSFFTIFDVVRLSRQECIDQLQS